MLPWSMNNTWGRGEEGEGGESGGGGRGGGERRERESTVYMNNAAMNLRC